MPNSTGSPLAPMRRSAEPQLVASPKTFGIRGVLKAKSATTKGQLGQYKLHDHLGQGGNATVMMGRTKTVEGSDELVAIKQTVVIDGESPEAERRAFKADGKSVRSGARAIREAHIQAMCHDHANIPTAFDLVRNDTSIFLVMELGDNGDLFDYVVEDGPLGFGESVDLFRQLVSAVAHMHSLGFAHRDIKPENILLTNAFRTPMLADFGCAVEFRRGDPLLSKATGTKRCFPPEMFLKSRENGTRRYDPLALDVWCLGVVLFFMLSARFPFDGDDDQETVLNILRGHVTTELPKYTPELLFTILKRMLEYDPAKRATLEEVQELLKDDPELAMPSARVVPLQARAPTQ